ncbi:MAG: hypothetical protein VKK80_03880 [Prochlorothrix sp.]|nr:hypothetical protein [Prochlorothrix sp.]
MAKDRKQKRLSAKGRVEQGKHIVTPATTPAIPPGQPKPLFSLQFLNQEYGLSACTQEEKAAFADTLYHLSQLSWTEIISAPRHGLGCEKIKRNSIRSAIPAHITEEVNFIAFRFYGKAPIVGYREGNIFHLIWLDRNFKLYDHG